MEIILLESIGKLGSFGDTVRVKPGYARNFLVPQKKALPATAANLSYFEEKKQEFEEQLKHKQDLAQNRADLLKSCNLSVEMNAHDDDKLYGSVGIRDIEALIKEQNIEINRNEIQLPEGPIRQAGDYQIHLQLTPDIGVDLNLTIIAKQQNKPEPTENQDNG